MRLRLVILLRILRLRRGLHVPVLRRHPAVSSLIVLNWRLEGMATVAPQLGRKLAADEVGVVDEVAEFAPRTSPRRSVVHLAWNSPVVRRVGCGRLLCWGSRH